VWALHVSAVMDEDSVHSISYQGNEETDRP